MNRTMNLTNLTFAPAIPQPSREALARTLGIPAAAVYGAIGEEAAHLLLEALRQRPLCAGPAPAENPNPLLTELEDLMAR